MAETETKPSPMSLHKHSLGDATCQTGVVRQRRLDRLKHPTTAVCGLRTCSICTVCRRVTAIGGAAGGVLFHCCPGDISLRSYVMSILCLSVCLRNHTAELHPNFYACCLWPWFGPTLVALCTSGVVDDVTQWPYGASCACISERRQNTTSITAKIPTK